jgi:hypothetical protein
MSQQLMAVGRGGDCCIAGENVVWKALEELFEKIFENV